MTGKSFFGLAYASASSEELIFASRWSFAPAGVVSVAVTMTATRHIPAQRMPNHPRLLTRLPPTRRPAAFHPVGR